MKRGRWKTIKSMSREPISAIVRRCTERSKRLRNMRNLDAPQVILDLLASQLHDCRAAMELCEQRLAMEFGLEYVSPKSDINQFIARRMAEQGYETTPAEAVMHRDSAAETIRQEMEKKGYEMPRTSIGVMTLAREIYKGASHARRKRD